MIGGDHLSRSAALVDHIGEGGGTARKVTVPFEGMVAGDVVIDAAARIVTSYVSFNHIGAEDLPAMIEGVVKTIRQLAAPVPVLVDPPITEAALKETVTHDYIICLEDGKRFKSLKGHLRTLGLTPEQYRAKWNLPPDYPMVAPNFSAIRSAIAVRRGLGRKRKADLAALE